MKTNTLKLVSIGNSKGVRLPATLIKKYHITNTLTAEEKEDGIFLRPLNPEKLSWEESFKQMADDGKESEEWLDFENTIADGDDEL